MRSVVLIVGLVGCAKGSSPLAQTDAPPQVDASHVDAFENFTDAPPHTDAPMADAPMADAACAPVTTELLANPVFDATPMGTGWQQTPIDPAFPLITNQDGIAEQSAPYKAWLGGIEADSGQVSDKLWQDVTVPANTTSLVLTGYYEVRTGEDPSDPNVYDSGSIALTQTNDTVIATVLNLSNRTPTTAWTAINHSFAQNLSGMPVRLRMTSSNDISFPTSFYFDTLSLKATHCP